MTGGAGLVGAALDTSGVEASGEAVALAAAEKSAPVKSSILTCLRRACGARSRGACGAPSQKEGQIRKGRDQLRTYRNQIAALRESALVASYYSVMGNDGFGWPA